MSKLECTCGSSYRSAGDYKLAIAMGWDVEYTHALLDLWENCLDEVLADHSQENYDRLKEEYANARKDLA